MCEGQTLADALRAEAAVHPLGEPCDAVKLVYQHCFGPGHLVEDGEARARLAAELAPVRRQKAVHGYERIGNGLVRVPLAGFDGSADTLASAFAVTAALCRDNGAEAAFADGLQLLRGLAEDGLFAFSAAELDRYLAGRPASPPGHSERYRAAYAPAYRVVSALYADFRALFDAIDARLASAGDKNTLVAIDGRSGSGKTTLTSFVSAVYGCAACHTDDFFLPPERKTPERLAEPGGNSDRERFEAEVLRPARSGKVFSYRPYSCKTGSLADAVTVNPSPLLLIEGVYSLHPALGSYDLTAFLTLPPEKQSRRILERSGPALHQRFIREWIPLEEAYFRAFGIREHCDLVFEI